MRKDALFLSLLPQIEELVKTWVEEALKAGCPYVKVSGTGSGGFIFFKNYEGKEIRRALKFREAFHKAGRFRPPFAEMTDYALECTLKDPRMKKWVTPKRWNSVKRA
jgi:hypothetical protein